MLEATGFVQVKKGVEVGTFVRELEQHGEIFEAIKAIDLQRAKRALRFHIRSTTACIEKMNHKTFNIQERGV
jgi:DNA-binding GntR family transcriptional regulator